MSGDVGEFPLLNRRTGQWEQAALVSPIGDGNIRDFEKLWKPMLEAKAASLNSANEYKDANLQDIYWSWHDKHVERANRLDWESFAVECEGKTQGLMFVNRARFARAQDQRGMPLLYVDLLSVAPWNRPRTTEFPKYKGVGTLLIGAAISLSIDDGYKGRVGLHSLPQSTTWYRDTCRMSELGPDPDYQNLVYFEFTPEQAADYLES